MLKKRTIKRKKLLPNKDLPDISIVLAKFLTENEASESEIEMYKVLCSLGKKKPSRMSEIRPLYKNGASHRMNIQHTLQRMIAKGLVARDGLVHYLPVVPDKK